MSSEIQQLITDIEAAAVKLGLSPSTIGERAGQGGMFYDRIKSGARAWPETIASVREKIGRMVGETVHCEKSHEDAPGARQAVAPEKVNDRRGKSAPPG